MSGVIAASLDKEQAVSIINDMMPPEVKEDLGGFLRAFSVTFKDKRQVLFIELERGYLCYFYRPEENAKAAVYLSPEAAYAFGMLYALFSKVEDESRFWEELDPEQALRLNEALAETALAREDAQDAADAETMDDL